MKEQGLTTEDAFEKLFECISAKLEEYKSEKHANWRTILQSSFSTKSHYSIISWCTYLVLIIESLTIIFLCAFNYGLIWEHLLIEAILMIFICIFNAGLIIWDNKMRLNELPIKIEKILNEVKEFTRDIHWEEENYPDINMPCSPCINLQYCFRDRKLVNLPYSLIVPGDLILLQPAQKILARCYLLNNEEKILEAGTTFSPNDGQPISDFDENNDYQNNPRPRLHLPLKNIYAVCTESPYVKFIEASLANFLKRPSTFYIKERHMIVTRILECIVLPAALMILSIFSLIKMFYLPHWLGSRVITFSEIIILQPITFSFPIIPLSLPLLYLSLNALGNARIHYLFEQIKRKWNVTNENKTYNEKHDLKLPDEFEVNMKFSEIYKEVWHFFFQGREDRLHRSQKLLHVLASLSAFCCVDKKGILSWPNPTADKIFLLKSEIDPTTKKRETVEEVLDLTNDPNNALELLFDDSTWDKNIPNLKPLGLNILLNCNLKRNIYTSFHSHLSYEAYEFQRHGGDFIVPVQSRRCLCDIARLVGFTENASQVFKLENELCAFRHIKEPDEAGKLKLKRANIKFPFPHMTSLIVRERLSQSLQLMAQGTADLILDSCEDFWDGSDLNPLNQEEKRLILEFYQRTSLTSICLAFAYKPVNARISNHLASLYVELESALCYSSIRNDVDRFSKSQEGQLISSSIDCLSNTPTRKKSAEKEVNNLEGLIDIQNGQVFLGMVSLEYQACMDVVQLVEQLDQACIRFVHFSKENELRSQVFGNNLGLESGWNTHICLENPKPQRERGSFKTDSSKNSNTEMELAPTKGIFTESATSLISDSKIDDEDVGIPPKKTYSYSTLIKPGEDKHLLSRCSSSFPEINQYQKDVDEKSDLINTHGLEANPAALLDKPLKDVRFAKLDDGGDDQRRSNRNSLSIKRQESTTPTDSYNEVYDFVEHSTPIGYDMQNRAKLPRGIAQVRPHLENVDNVPLLVSLFTDSTSESTREMINIMQDYGEVVLLIGAGSNIENKNLFTQADASFSFEPMYPNHCTKKHCFIPPKQNYKSPTEIAMILTQLPASLLFEKNEPLSIVHLIAQARHFMNNCLRNSLQFYLCCKLGVSFLGLMSVLTLLPPLYTIGDVLWLSLIIIPILSFALTFSLMDKMDPNVMSCASYKNQFILNKQMLVFSFWFYGMKFIPSILNVCFMSIYNLRSICASMDNSTCIWVYPQSQLGDPMQPQQTYTYCQSSWSCEYSNLLLVVQQFSLFSLTLYFVLISASFLYRSKFIWVENPLKNKVWIISSIVVILLQTLYFFIKIRSIQLLGELPYGVFIWCFLWIFVLLAFNELLKRYQIKINIRFKKRAALDFNTKLGMNSPY